MQITWELFEIANGLKKHASKHQGVFTLKIWSATDHCFQDKISRVDVFFSTAFFRDTNTSSFFFLQKKLLIHIVTNLLQTRSAYKTVRVLFFYKNLLTFQ